MTKEEYLILYEKVQSGTYTAHEKMLLEACEKEFETGHIPWDEAAGDAEAIRSRIYSRLAESIDPAVRKLPAPRTRLWQAAAALFLPVMLLAGYEVRRHQIQPVQGIVKTKSKSFQVFPDLNPGKNTAVLVLADGKRISLDQAGTGLLDRQGRTEVQKNGDGQITFKRVKDADHAISKLVNGLHTSEAEPDPAALNTVSTPRGGQYRLVLSDGTRVWLNAASALSFAPEFKNNSRQVLLRGEAYFEVAKNKAAPFTVIAGNTHVQVLGTHFNVKAYDDERLHTTTLLEGSVQINQGSLSRKLVPGQMAICSLDVIKIAEANTEEAVSWKNGYFMFAQENIQSVMKQVSRWYDVDIAYKSNITHKTFTGSISRFSKISEILHMLQLTGLVHFQVEGRRIIVMP